MQVDDTLTAIVTGAANGFGRAVSEALAARGAHVVACDKSDAVEGLTAELGTGVRPVVADVGDIGDVRRIVATAADIAGSIDVIVNNAAVAPATSLHDSLEKSAADLELAVWTNVRGPLLLQRAALPVMMRGGRGHILNVSSDHVHTCGWPVAVRHDSSTAECPWHHLPARRPGVLSLDLYDTTKFALNAFAADWGQLLQPHGIQVNNFCPGTFDSPAVRHHLAELGKELPPRAKSWIALDALAGVVIDLIEEEPGRTCDNVGVWCGHPLELPPPGAQALSMDEVFTPSRLPGLVGS
jgi:NAD(P)-dependent dehydrogenase (short-subunit alcohol dehydrogenase family)